MHGLDPDRMQKEGGWLKTLKEGEMRTGSNRWDQANGGWWADGDKWRLGEEGLLRPNQLLSSFHPIALTLTPWIHMPILFLCISTYHPEALISKLIHPSQSSAICPSPPSHLIPSFTNQLPSHLSHWLLYTVYLPSTLSPDWGPRPKSSTTPFPQHIEFLWQFIFCFQFLNLILSANFEILSQNQTEVISKC